MSGTPLRICAVATTLIVAVTTQLGAWDPGNPDDPVAQAAATAALRSLGPDRGALGLASDIRTLASEIRDLAGLGLGLKAGAEDLNAALLDLNAKVTDTEIQVEVSSDLLFDFDKAVVKPKAEGELARLATVVRKSRKGLVLINGHTDSVGEDAYNQRLSERRADAVKGWLVAKGKIQAEVIKTQGFGKSKPVAPNTHPDGSDNPDGRAKNRRVEVIIQTTSKPQ